MEGLPFSILVVDDDEDDRFIIDEAFKEIGYESEIKKFISGDALLHYLEQIDASLYPSLIVLDNVLTKGDASSLLGILKNNTSYRSIPVIIYSTSISASRKEQLRSMGAYACIEKGALMGDVIEVAKQLKSVAEKKVHD
jgi:CheY-like chemotaxis protein